MECGDKMSKFKLGRTSLRRLNSCCKELRLIIEEGIKVSEIDFGVVCGFRGKEEQEKAFQEGNSLAKWGESDHNFLRGSNPYSLAVDIAPYSVKLKNYLWDNDKLFKEIWVLLSKIAEAHKINLRWGGDFKIFRDLPHFYIKLRN